MIERLLPVRALSRPRVASASIAALASLFAATGAARAVNDTDVFWIAAAGRWTLDARDVPRANLFSFTEPDHPWVMHEWLYGVLYSEGLGALGPRFFSAFAALSGMITLALVLALALRKKLPVAALATLLALVPLGDVFHAPRPAFASLWLPALMILACERRHLVLCVITELLWTQLHGSFPIGLALLACFLAEERSRARALALAGACAVTLANPYSAKLHLLVLGYGAGQGEMRWLHEHIVEFFPVWRVIGTPWFSAHAAVALALTCALALSALLRGRHRARAGLTLLLAFMALLHVRHWALASLTGALLLLPELDALVRAEPAPFSRARLLAGALAPPLACALVALALRRGPAIAPELGGDQLEALVQRLPPGANLYADQAFASPAIWHGARVFYDLRNDCYSAAMHRDFTLVLERKPEALGMLRARGTTHALVRADDALFSSWPEIAREGELVLRATP